jgi:hypothetical protein
MRNNACILANDYQMIFPNQTQCYKTQSNLPSMINTNLSNECEMRRVLAYLVSMLNTTIHDNQLSTLCLNKSVMTKSGCVEEDFVMPEITDNKSILQKQPEYRSA